MSRQKTNTVQRKASNSPNGLVDRSPDPVKTEGTTEIPVLDPVAGMPEDPMRQRFEESEKQKEKDIKKLEKESDGEPKV